MTAFLFLLLLGCAVIERACAALPNFRVRRLPTAPGRHPENRLFFSFSLASHAVVGNLDLNVRC